MFKVFDEDCAVLPARDSRSHQIESRMTTHGTLSQNDDTGGRKIFLPRGPLQAKCGPQPYFYFASKSGAVPSWIIDQTTRSDTRHLRSNSLAQSL